MIMTNQFLSIVSSFFVKKVQSQLWTNKKPSIPCRALCVIQNCNKLLHSNSVTFDAKKAKNTFKTRLSGSTINRKRLLNPRSYHKSERFTWWKTTLTPRALAYTENSRKCPPLWPSFLHPKEMSNLQRQTDFLNIFL